MTLGVNSSWMEDRRHNQSIEVLLHDGGLCTGLPLLLSAINCNGSPLSSIASSSAFKVLARLLASLLVNEHF